MIIYFFLFYINESLKQESIVTLSLYLCLASDKVHSELFVTAAVKQRIKLLKETWLLKSIIIKSLHASKFWPDKEKKKNDKKICNLTPHDVPKFYKNTPFVKLYVKVPNKHQHLRCYYQIFQTIFGLLR